jgi:hypothetical protein
MGVVSGARAFVVVAGLLAAGCSSGPSDTCNCPSFNVADWCSTSGACRVDANPAADALHCLTVSAGQTLSVGVASLLDQLAFHDLWIEPGAPVQGLGVALDGRPAAIVPSVSEHFGGGPLYAIWNPFPKSPMVLTLSFTSADCRILPAQHAGTCCVSLLFTDASCRNSPSFNCGL